MSLRAPPALTVPAHPPGLPLTLPMARCPRLPCHHPPGEPPTLPALGSHQPCGALTVLVDENERKVTLKNGHLEFDQVCSRY